MIKDLLNIFDEKINKNTKIINCVDDMKNYQGTDWEKYKSFSIENNKNLKNYFKNIIYRSDIYELILIKWEKGAETSIHNHPKHGCVMKLLEGNIIEERYDNNIKYKSTNMKNNSVGYMHDDLGSHKIIALEESYSLHLYSPPKYYS